jgi:hypothetical protein
MSDKILSDTVQINCISILDNKYYLQVNLFVEQVNHLIDRIPPEHDIYKELSNLHNFKETFKYQNIHTNLHARIDITHINNITQGIVNMSDRLLRVIDCIFSSNLKTTQDLLDMY